MKHLILLAFVSLFLALKGVDALTKKEIDECLRSHNALRFLHEDTPALQWDARLAADAQRWSDRLARSRSGYHDYNRNDGSGESWWYWQWYDDSKVYSCADATRSWYDEIKDYDWQTRKSNGGVVGHFTQLVWKDVKKIGVGISPVTESNGKKWLFIVARYDLQGNTNKINGEWVTDSYGRADKYKAYGLEVKPRKPNSKVPSIEKLRNGKGKGMYTIKGGSSTGGGSKGGTANGCTDSRTECPKWKGWGACEKDPNYMRKYCKKSCNICSDGCTDSNTKCPTWESWGECEKNPNYMRKYCKKSCNICGNTEKNKNKGGTSSGGEAEGVAPSGKSCTKPDIGAKVNIRCNKLKSYCGKRGGREALLRRYCACTCAGTWSSRDFPELMQQDEFDELNDEFDGFDGFYDLEDMYFI